MSAATRRCRDEHPDFEAMRGERMLYVDKTRFLHELEEVHYAFLMRPRGFGKSC